MPHKIYCAKVDNLHLEKNDLNIFNKAKVKHSEPSHY